MAELPATRSKKAPNFDGDPSELLTFFDDFEAAAIRAGLDDASKVAHVIRYVSSEEKKTWRRIAKSIPYNWHDFKQEIISEYPGAEEDILGTVTDVQQVVNDARNSGITSIAQLGAYYRRFTDIALPLIDAGVLGKIQAGYLLLDGFSQDFRANVEHVLFTWNSRASKYETYTCKNVYDAALYIFKGGNTPLVVPDPTTFHAIVPTSPSQAPSTLPIVKAESELLNSLQDIAATIQQTAATQQAVNQSVSQLLTQFTPLADSAVPATSINGMPPMVSANLLINKSAHTNDGKLHTQEIREKLQGVSKEFGLTKEESQDVLLNALATDAVRARPDNRPPSASPKANVTPIPVAEPPKAQYRSSIEDSKITDELVQRILQVPIQLTAKELLAVSPDVRRSFRDLVQPKRAPVSSINATSVSADDSDEDLHTKTSVKSYQSFAASAPSSPAVASSFSLSAATAHATRPLRAIYPVFCDKIKIESLSDSGSEIVAVRRDIWQQLQIGCDVNAGIVMETANGSKEGTIGLARNVKFNLCGIIGYLHLQIVENAPYDILLGRPFHCLVEASEKHYADGRCDLDMTDPQTGRRLKLATSERKFQPPIPVSLDNDHSFRESMTQ